MNKALYWLIGVLGIAVLLLMVWFIRASISAPVSTPNTVNSSNTLPSVPNASGPKDFLSDPAMVKDPRNPGYYYLGYHTAPSGMVDSTATANPPYIIEYIATTQYFNITLLEEPIKTTRQQAEQYLLQKLGISQDQACQLKYMVNVPTSINSTYAGQNLGFSFCPGAIPLQ